MSLIIKCIMVLTVLGSMFSFDNNGMNLSKKTYHSAEFDKNSFNSDENIEIDTFNSRWISNLPSETKPSNVSIPGTHDSMAFKMDTSGLGGLQITKDKTLTQSLDIEKQLKMGIRYFDIRAQIKNGKFGMYHGSIWLNSYFDDYLDEVLKFIEENPEEFILMRFKSEGDDSMDSFESTLKSVYLDNPKYQGLFYLNKITDKTTVGDLRGKIVFIQNFNSSKVSVGGYVYPYQYIQDAYEIGNSLNDLHKKSELIISHFESADYSSEKLSLNHLSGSSSGIFSSIYPWYVSSGFTGKNTNIFKDTGSSDSKLYPLWPIEDGKVKVAGTNVVTLEYIKSNHSKNLGIVIMDYPGQELVNRIIRNNVFKDEKNGSLNIKYFAEDAEEVPMDSTLYVKHSLGAINKDIPIRVGHKFKHWIYEGHDYAYLKNRQIFVPGESIYMYDNAILTGLWDEVNEEFSLDYISDESVENSPPKELSYKYNQLIKVSEMVPQKRGHRFLHWKYHDEAIESGTMLRITENIELIPVWEEKEANTIDLTDEAKTSMGLWIFAGE